METVQNQDPPSPLDSGLDPVLLFDHSDGIAGVEPSDARYLYSIPKRQLLLARGFDGFIRDVNWITPQGWVLTLDLGTRATSLRDPFTSRTVHLPTDTEYLLTSSDTTRCFLSTHSPADHGCVVLVVHLTGPVLCYCHPGDNRWFKHRYRPEQIDGDRDNAIRVMASLTAAAGKFYAHLAVDNKVVMLEFSPEPTLTTVHVASRPRPVGCSYVRYCELESCGELFMVRFCYTPLSGRRIMCVEVQKLDWSRSAWVKAAVLGVNRVFFVRWGQVGASMAANELGLKANCIYFTKDGDKGLYVHDLEQGTTTLSNPGRDVPNSMEPILLVPAARM